MSSSNSLTLENKEEVGSGIWRALLDHTILQLVRLYCFYQKPRLNLWYWKLSGRQRMPNPAFPKTPNDKFLWAKFFDRDLRFRRLVDKIAVRDWLAELGNPVTAPDMLWRGHDAAEIPASLLEEPVVLKANHACGTNMFVLEAPQDRAKLNADGNKMLKKNHGSGRFEWAYTGIPRELFLERFVGTGMIEAKIFVYRGKIGRIHMIYERLDEEACGDIWTMSETGVDQCNVLGHLHNMPAANKPLPDFVEMAKPVAEKLGAAFDQVRVDLAWDGEKLWFSEMTFTNLGGYMQHDGHLENTKLNRLWGISNNAFFDTPQTGWRKVYQKALARRLAAMN